MPVASLIKRAQVDIVRPLWLFDSIQQMESDGNRPGWPLPLEPKHLFFSSEDKRDVIRNNVDEFGDSYYQDVTMGELRQVFTEMPKSEYPINAQQLRRQLDDQDHSIGETPGCWMFEKTLMYPDFQSHKDLTRGLHSSERERKYGLRMQQALNTARFAGAHVTNDLEDLSVTHVLVDNDDHERTKILRRAVSG